MARKQTRSHWFEGTVLHVDKAGIMNRASIDKLRGLSATDVCVHNEAGIDMPPALLIYLCEVLSAIKGGHVLESKPLGLGIDPKTIASADWSDDDEPTGSGPIDDLQPIGRVTPVPGIVVLDESTLPSSAAARVVYTEPEEEPTMLGPFPEPEENGGGVPQPARVDVRTHCGVPVPGNSAPEGEWKVFHQAVEDNLCRQRLIDEVAIQLYTKGFPSDGLYAKAEKFWALREAYLQRKR